MKTLEDFASIYEFITYLETKPWQSSQYSMCDLGTFSRNLYGACTYIRDILDATNKIDFDAGDQSHAIMLFHQGALEDLMRTMEMAITAIEAELDGCASNICLNDTNSEHLTIWVEFGQMKQL